MPRIKRDISDKVVLAEGEDLYLKCLCDSRKPYSVKWFFNGNQLNLSDASIAADTKNDSIHKVHNVTKATQGSYKCILSNLAGSDQMDFTVEVVGKIILS